ncbi:MAG TPA: SDR family NAD(P)-dependent oxidoreductase [Polyangiaceae bacterium]|jgi:NAD(P)-dependent dehydrogenase (short-subunit alcohol dehydrogenase family)|nr:SDR family NAD(P)-dependent oxidoreductase [Polyangiaceae bacterium]
MKRFQGRTVLITGAGSGIGRATAERFGSEGASVVCADINAKGVEETAEAIRTQGGDALGLVCDVSKPPSVDETFAKALERYKRLDVLANVAGVGGFRRLTETTFDDWNRTIGINLTGTFLTCQKAISHILASKGAIINVASVAGLKSHPYSAAYCASKGGIVTMTKALAVEFGRKGVRINCLCPGGVETPMIQQFQLPEGVKPDVLAKIMPLGRMGQPAEIAATIAFLASDDASYMNGSVVVVDGGMIA